MVEPSILGLDSVAIDNTRSDIMSPRNATEASSLLGIPRDDSASNLSNISSKRSFDRSRSISNQWPTAKHNLTPLQALNLAMFACSIILLGVARHQATWNSQHPFGYKREPTTNSKYLHVQGMGFQIYTGGAPAFFNITLEDGSMDYQENPECIGLDSYGSMWTEEGDQLQCYLGNYNADQDVQTRLKIMQDAVEQAYRMSDRNHDPTTLKIFIAPEFFWRGVNGAYIFQDEAPGDDSICGPVCQILMGLEEIVAEQRFEDWLFLFGSITASEPIKDRHNNYDSLFYNFAPVYKGYDPKKTTYHGKRFIAPKRYLSTSDFMTPQRHLNLSNWKEVIDFEETKTHQQSTVINPIYTRGKYDLDLWSDYKDELDALGYVLLEYGWLMVDGLAVSLEICLDHQVQTAFNAYNADMTTGRKTLIPSITDHGLEYVHIPPYQAQIGVVSSAGMTIVKESMALTQHGTIFLQDGLSNLTNRMYWSNTGCELGLQFEGGTEAVQRRAFLSSTDVFFEHKPLEDFHRYNVYDDDEWKTYINGTFTTTMYPPQITVFDAIDIAKVYDKPSS